MKRILNHAQAIWHCYIRCHLGRHDWELHGNRCDMCGKTR